MKTINSKIPLIRSSIALAAMIAVWTPASSWSAEPAEGKEMKMESTMMAHMENGGESMSKCPMMKEMNEKSEGAHAEHHEKSE